MVFADACDSGNCNDAFLNYGWVSIIFVFNFMDHSKTLFIKSNCKKIIRFLYDYNLTRRKKYESKKEYKFKDKISQIKKYPYIYAV